VYTTPKRGRSFLTTLLLLSPAPSHVWRRIGSPHFKSVAEMAGNTVYNGTKLPPRHHHYYYYVQGPSRTLIIKAKPPYDL
jgi:hypothetical protein